MPNQYYRPVNQQVINVTAASVACTNPFSSQTSLIRIATGPIGVWYKLGVTPVATISDIYLPQNWVEILTSTPGEKIAIIQPTSPSGTFSVTELTN